MSLYYENSPSAESSETKIFGLRKLDWSNSGAGDVNISKMAAGNNVVVAATAACSVLRWKLDSSNNEEEIEISRRPADKIAHLFVDPTGHHIIICLENGDHYYLHSRSSRPKKFSKSLHGNIESIAFDRDHGNESSTKSFLAGTSLGCVYEIAFDSTGKEKVCQLVYQLDDEKFPITSLHFDIMKSTGAESEDDVRIFVMLATSTPTRLYHFLGGPTFSQLFDKYASHDVDASFTELPGDLERAELHCYSFNQSQNRAQMFALMTKEGIYHGSLLFSDADVNSENILIEAQLMPYSDSLGGDPPLSIAATEYHFLMLSYDKLLSMSSLNGSLVEEELLRVADGNAIGLVRDIARNTIWLYTDSFIFQLMVIDEDQRIWSIYLDKALAGDERMFDVAYEHCKKKKEQAQVMKARAEFSLSCGNIHQAASYFARSGAAFEDVVLLLLRKTTDSQKDHSSTKTSKKPLEKPDDLTFIVTDGPELSALRIYLLEEMQMLSSNAKSQRTMICTWLSEIFLHQITMSDLNIEKVTKNNTQDAVAHREELIGTFKEFLEINKSALDEATTLTLITRRGCSGCHRDLLLHYAKIIGDYDRIVEHYITEKLYDDAVNMLVNANFDRVEELIYKFAPVLIQYKPEVTVQMLVSKKGLKISGVIYALLRYSSVLDAQYKFMKMDEISPAMRIDMDANGNKVNFAVKYLTNCMSDVISAGEDESFSATLCHTLLSFLVKYDESDETELCSYLQQLSDLKFDGSLLAGDINFDFILRQCKLYDRKRATAYAYYLLGMEYEAVVCASSIDIEIAKEIAQNPRDLELKKKLWLVIAENTIRSDSDAKRALLLLKESEGTLRIEDLLPLLPDFTEIELFKEDICQTLQDCGSRIDHLKSEMQELSESAESINNELESMKKRGYSVSSLQRCEYCVKPLFSQLFYLFPCSHGFHQDCLLRRVYTHKHLEDAQLQTVKSLEVEIRSISSRSKDDKRSMARLEYLQHELDGCIAADCPLCGYVMIRSLSTPLVSEEDKAESSTWIL